MAQESIGVLESLSRRWCIAIIRRVGILSRIWCIGIIRRVGIIIQICTVDIMTYPNTFKFFQISPGDVAYTSSTYVFVSTA